MMCVPVILVDKWMDNSSQPRTFSIDADVIHKTIRAVKENFLVQRYQPDCAEVNTVVGSSEVAAAGREVSSSATYYDANHVPSM